MLFDDTINDNMKCTIFYTHNFLGFLVHMPAIVSKLLSDSFYGDSIAIFISNTKFFSDKNDQNPFEKSIGWKRSSLLDAVPTGIGHGIQIREHCFE